MIFSVWLKKQLESFQPKADTLGLHGWELGWEFGWATRGACECPQWGLRNAPAAKRFSTPVIWSVIVTSCFFHPCHLVCNCQVLQCQASGFSWSIFVRSCIFSRPEQASLGAMSGDQTKDDIADGLKYGDWILVLLSWTVKVTWVYIPVAHSCETSKVLRHGSHTFTCGQHNGCFYLVIVHQMAPPLIVIADI